MGVFRQGIFIFGKGGRTAVKSFWISLLTLFVCINSISAIVLFNADFEHHELRMDMRSFFIGMIFGSLALLFVFVTAGCWYFADRPFPPLTRMIRYPVGYLVGLGILSAVLLVMQFIHLFDTQSSLHLPFWGYILFVIVVYPVCGYLLGRKMKGSWTDLLWGILFAVILCAICFALYYDSGALFDESWHTEIESSQTYVNRVRYEMRGILYIIFARVNLPACVLMDNYAKDCYNELCISLAMEPRMLFYLCCACPPILFSLGWSIAVIREKFSKKSEKGDNGI